jgi:hypothetical protein
VNAWRATIVDVVFLLVVGALAWRGVLPNELIAVLLTGTVYVRGTWKRPPPKDDDDDGPTGAAPVTPRNDVPRERRIWTPPPPLALGLVLRRV